MDQFNHSIIEKDIERLGKEIAEKRNLLGRENLSERELIKQALHPLIKSTTNDLRLTTNNKRQTIDDQQQIGNQVLPNYLKDSPDEIKLQVEKLIDAFFHQGIEKTVKEANQAGPFILDAFHDALTDKLHEELKKRKLI